MNMAPYRVTAMIGGRSKLLIDWYAYCPTPCRSNTVSVRIAPPPSTAAKSSPNSVMIGISDRRRMCFRMIRFGARPFAFAVRT